MPIPKYSKTITETPSKVGKVSRRNAYPHRSKYQYSGETQDEWEDGRENLSQVDRFKLRRHDDMNGCESHIATR
jgi:hypothetical protein